MPVADAPWWNPDSPQDGKPLRRNAPTLNQYHHPDQRQLERMRSGIGTPLIIPKATSDGASPAFNAHEPGVVHVDPDAPDGGAIVDLTHLNRNQMRKALSQSSFPHQVYYQLGVSPSLIGGGFNRMVESREPDRQNSLLPNDYVVPKAAQDGGQSGYYQQTPGFGPVAPTVVNGYTPPLPNPAFQVVLRLHTPRAHSQYPPRRRTCGAFLFHHQNCATTSPARPSAAYFHRVSGAIVACPMACLRFVFQRGRRRAYDMGG
jgi:hypothetical protein